MVHREKLLFMGVVTTVGLPILFLLPFSHGPTNPGRTRLRPGFNPGQTVHMHVLTWVSRCETGLRGVKLKETKDGDQKKDFE